MPSDFGKGRAEIVQLHFEEPKLSDLKFNLYRHSICLAVLHLFIAAIQRRLTHLVEVGYGRAFTHPIFVWHIDELVIVRKPWIAPKVLWRGHHIGQVLQLLVPPIVQLCESRSGTSLQSLTASALATLLCK